MKKKIHSLDNTKCNQVCGICNLKCRTIVDLHKHIKIKHPDIKLIFHDKIFYCQSDFDQWKGKIECQTVSHFILNFTKINENSEVLHYKCHRSGLPKACESLTGKRKRRSKYAGTIKAGITCPAVIKATKETIHEATQITVQYQSTHVGHKCEAGKLPLQKEERTILADMLSCGIPISAVIDRIQAQFSPTKRLGLTTRQDIYNVARDFKVSNIVHKDDAMAVDIQEIMQEEYNPVLVYKPVGEKLEQYPCIEKEEFLLGICPEAQMDVLNLYGKVRENINDPITSVEEGHLVINVTEKEISEKIEKNIILKQICKKPRKDLNDKKLVIEHYMKNIYNKVQSLESFEDLQYVEDNLKNIQAYLEVTKKSELQTSEISKSTPSNKKNMSSKKTNIKSRQKE